MRTPSVVTVPPAGRLPALDILRGVAILGTLGTNIWLFAAAGTPLTEAFSGAREPIQALFEMLCNGKFLSLLSILFGAGVAIQYDAARRRMQPWPGPYLRRTGLLFLEGLLHFTLLFEGDVLMGYALAAVIVALLLRGGDQALAWGMGVAAGLHLLLLALLVAVVGSAPAAPGVDDGFAAYATLLGSSDYLGQVAFRLQNALVLRAEPILALPYTVFLFLLGVQFVRRGIFVLGAAPTQGQRALMRWGLGLGLPLNALALLPTGGEQGLGALDALVFLALRYGFSAILACGYIGLLLWLLQRTAPAPAWSALSNVGRTALSTYVSQSLLCALLFYGWGLGLGGQLSAGQIAALFVALGAFQLGVAQLWMRYLGGGPMELLRARLEGRPQAPMGSRAQLPK